jgi:hypothetical protein
MGAIDLLFPQARGVEENDAERTAAGLRRPELQIGAAELAVECGPRG